MGSLEQFPHLTDREAVNMAGDDCSNGRRRGNPASSASGNIAQGLRAKGRKAIAQSDQSSSTFRTRKHRIRPLGQNGVGSAAQKVRWRAHFRSGSSAE